MASSALVLFLHFLRKGEFDNIEDAKYQMFRDEDES